MIDRDSIEHDIFMDSLMETRGALISKVICQIMSDFSLGELDAIAELLSHIPDDILQSYIPEEE